jgi:hypothetical protein
MLKQAVAFLKSIGGFFASHELRIWLRMGRRPLTVLALLAGLLWLGGWLDAQIARAEIQELACPVGLEQNGALCYPLCESGFYGVGPVCFQHCPVGYTDDGAICRKDAHIFAKASYGRGAGVGLICAPNQEAQGGLCYPKCAATHYGVGPVCWQRCPAGYADHGVTCYRGIFDFFGKNTYGRGAGGPVNTCAPGLERNGSLCYPRCNAGFYGAGPVCFQRCPTGYTDDGALCRKDAHIFAKASYGRGAGEAPNAVPVALDETVQTAKDTPVRLKFEHTDDDDDTGKPIILVQETSHGLVAGDHTYTPDVGFEGVDTILWKTTDGKHESNVAAATILVGNVGANNAPVAIDRTVAVTEETPIAITVTCTDAENDELFYQLVDKPQHGDYQWQPPNTVIYTPTLDFVGVDFFTFRAHDGRDFSSVSTITLTVTAINDAPVARAQTVTTTRNSNVAVNLLATDAESEPISYTVVSSPTQGLVSGTAPALLYTPNRDFTGTDSFQFAARDPHGATTTATISVTIVPSNTAPLAASQLLTTSAESAVAVVLSASDADEDTLTYTLVTPPTHGTLTGDGADWVYLPNVGFSGTDTFTFQSADSITTSAPATVTIQVTAVPALASVVGLVFADSNANGQPDPSEVGVGGLAVTLTSTAVQGAGGRTAFSTQTDAIGAWRIDDVPLGTYTLRIASSDGVQLAAPAERTITVGERGVQQIAPTGVQVTGRLLFLPSIVR